MFNKETKRRLNNQAARIQNLEWESQRKDLDIQHLSDAIKKLDKVLVEAGILEYQWTPATPKGSVIHFDGHSPDGPTYTKVNKVF